MRIDKVKLLKKAVAAVMAVILLNIMGNPVTTTAAETLESDMYMRTVEKSLRSANVGEIIQSSIFPDKKSVYSLMEQLCNGIDAPELFLDNQCYVTYRMVTLADHAEYFLSAEIERYEKINDLDTGKIIKELNLDGSSELEIAIRVHEWLADELEYGKSQGSLSDCLEAGYGKCDDYSMIYAAVMNAAGVETRCMDGVPNGSRSGHMWNMVCLDHVWYLCDVTNDDLEDTYRYFMRAVSSDDVREYLGSYMDGYRLCNGVDEFSSYKLAKKDYFSQQYTTKRRTVSLSSILGISRLAAKRATAEAVSDGDYTISLERPENARYKIRIEQAGGVVYGSYRENTKTYRYLIRFS